MKLELGNYYRLRNGEVVGPLEATDDPSYAFKCSETGEFWTADGWFEAGFSGTLMDIFTELDPHDYYKEHNLQLFKKNVLSAGIKQLVQRAHGDAVAAAAGWYTDLATGERVKLNVGERIALMHSELSEAFEAARKDLMDDHLPHRKGLEVELADCMIRICDFAGSEGLDLGGAILEKLEYNRNRADHKLENSKADNGKKYL